VADDVHAGAAKLEGCLAHNPGEAYRPQEVVHALVLHQGPIARKVCGKENPHTSCGGSLARRRCVRAVLPIMSAGS
jgi:hypothetical protein